MIYVFDREENLLAMLSNENKGACPYWNADVKEVLGAEFTFTFTIPFTHSDAVHVQELGYVAFLDYERNYQLFVVSEIEEIHAGELVKEVFCEHASIELFDDILDYFFVDRKDVTITLPLLLNGTQWKAGTMQNTTQHDLTIRGKSVREALSTFSQRWGVELRFRINIVGTVITDRYIDAVVRRGEETGKRFEFRKDMIEVRRTILATDVKTALYGYGKTSENTSDSTITTEDTEKPRLDFSQVEWSTTKGNPINKPAGQKWIGLESARLLYGRKTTTGMKLHRFGTYQVNDIEDPVELLQATYEQLLAVSTPTIQYSAKVIDLMKILGLEQEQVHIGDSIYVIDTDLNMRVSARVIEYHFDLTIPEQSEIVLGNFLPKLTSEMDDIQTVVDQSVSQAVSVSLPDNLLQEGDPISTSWLDGIIHASKNQINAGSGTVTITEDNGILIVDNPTNPQKALKLVAGTLALANTRNANTGLFNWRTFGTGEGLLADLVTTGFLRFDRSQGGTLTLGGANNQNGVLEVLDPSGEKRVTLTGNSGGFDELFIGRARGNNLVLKNDQGEFTLYFDPVNGNDSNDGRSTDTPKATIQACIASLPIFSNDNTYIECTRTNITFNETVVIEGFLGHGRIMICLGRRNKLKGEFNIDGNIQEIQIRTDRNGYTTTANVGAERAEIINQNRTGTAGVIRIHFSMYVYLTDIVINANNLCYFGAYNIGGMLKAFYCEFYNATIGCIHNTYAGTLECNDCSGQSERGLSGTGACVIGGNGRAPRGTKYNIYLSEGAQCTATFTHDAGTAKPIYAPIKTTTWEANDTKSLFGTNWGLTNYIYQGKRPSETTAWYGVMFFHTRDFSELKNADGTNRPITKVRVKLQRSNDTGENNSRYPKFYYNLQTAASGGIATIRTAFESPTGFLWGEEKWVTLPNSYGEAFRDGAAKSLVLRDGTAEDNYMRFMPKATLEITHG